MDDTALGETYLDSARASYRAMKRLGEHAIQQMGEEDLHWSMNDECNCVTILIQHLRGNMLSRWTDPLTTDGEKPGRNRDGEFVSHGRATREALLAEWEEGWLFARSLGFLFAARSFETADHSRARTFFARGNQPADLSLLVPRWPDRPDREGTAW